MQKINPVLAVKNKGIIGLALGLLGLLYSCNNNSPQPVFYYAHIEPLLQTHCTGCHNPAGIAHIYFTNYQEAKKYASGIAYMTSQRAMPPWPANPGYTHFKGEKLLTEHEISLLKNWEQQGMPEGEKPTGSAPKPTTHRNRKPDLRLTLTPVTLPQNGEDQFLLMKIPYELPNDTFAALIEFVPGKHNKVHHVNGDLVKYEYNKKRNVFEGINLINTQKDSASQKEAFLKMKLPNDDGTFPVLQKSVVNYLPGAAGVQYPPAIGGYYLPRKGAFLLNDIHYGYNRDTTVTDTSYIDIYFAPKPPQRPVHEFQIGTLGIAGVQPDLLIAPNSIKRVFSRLKIAENISVLTINPHMHLLGKTFKAYALSPQNDTIRLISISRWDFNWQYFYTFPHPIKIPAHSTLIAEGEYDNTKDNPNNPFSPPQWVTDQKGSMKATDEMFQFIVTYIPYMPGDEDIEL
ncbi:MAG: hypothetical protein EBX41_03810 [Chitinophagia bacterium]|nr:hypothetical protein [Chitinophagia bacterium]